MLLGTNSEFLKAYNQRVVIEAIRREGAVSRSDIARLTGLSLQAISTIFQQLQRDGWIVEKGRRTVERGQPPIEYSLDPDGRVTFGVAVDLDGVSTVALDVFGRVLHREHGAAVRPDPETVMDLVSRHLEVIEKHPRVAGRPTLGIGVALPGTPDQDVRRVKTLPHMPGWEGAPFADALEKALSLPVHVANDAIAAGLGEAWFGPDEPGETLFYVFFAHGLNGAVFTAGRPYGGLWGVTGKFGHIPVVPDGFPCRVCGNRGCTECYASLLSLLAHAGIPISETSSIEVAERFAADDPQVLAWLEQAVIHLATALLSVENLFDPGAVVFGGRLPPAMLRRLIREVERQIGPRRMSLKDRHPIYRASIHGADAAVIGAAALPLHLALAPDIDLVFEHAGREEAHL